jgi:hypothetical protein
MAILVPYLGMMTVGLRTYTTTYAPFNAAAWDFNDHAKYAMEFTGFLNNTVHIPIGFYANLIDSVTGYTTISVGDNTPANADIDFGTLAWDGMQLGGFCFGEVGTDTANAVLYPAINGMPYTASFNSRFSIFAGLQPNSQFPYPYTGANWYAPDGGIYTSGENQLAQTAWELYNNGTAGGNIANVGTLNYHVNNGVNYKGATYWQVKNPVDNTDRNILMVSASMGANAVGPLPVTFVTPPGCSVNIDTLLTQSINYGRIAPNGFLFVTGNVMTLGPLTLNGYGIFINADYSGYRIIQFIPADTGSANWFGLAGDYHAKFDQHGAMWIKNVNNHTTLFVSAGSVLKLLPIFFPVPIPGTEDIDPALRLMRSN